MKHEIFRKVFLLAMTLVISACAHGREAPHSGAKGLLMRYAELADSGMPISEIYEKKTGEDGLSVMKITNRKFIDRIHTVMYQIDKVPCLTKDDLRQDFTGGRFKEVIFRAAADGSLNALIEFESQTKQGLMRVYAGFVSDDNFRCARGMNIVLYPAH